jgi:hypothetical protein
MDKVLLFLLGVGAGAYFSNEVKQIAPILDKDKANG